MLERITDHRHAVHASARKTSLAIRVARHTTHGWDSPALPDEVHDIASNLSEAATRRMLFDLDR